MPLLTGNVKSRLKNKFLNTPVCLEGNKREAFLVSLENKAFKGTILVLGSPIAKLFSQLNPFFIAAGLPKEIQTNTAQENKVLQLLI